MFCGLAPCGTILNYTKASTRPSSAKLEILPREACTHRYSRHRRGRPRGCVVRAGLTPLRWKFGQCTCFYRQLPKMQISHRSAGALDTFQEFTSTVTAVPQIRLALTRKSSAIKGIMLWAAVPCLAMRCSSLTAAMHLPTGQALLKKPSIAVVEPF